MSDKFDEDDGDAEFDPKPDREDPESCQREDWEDPGIPGYDYTAD